MLVMHVIDLNNCLIILPYSNTEHQDPSMELQENACYKDTYYVGEDSEQRNE